MMVYPNQETFFIRNRNVMLHSESFQGKEQLVTVEELYQHFKTRMMAELSVDVHGATHYGKLVELDKLKEKG